jgi:hypothetical protein
MKTFFRPLFLGVLVSISVSFSACESKPDVPPNSSPSTGNVSGQVLPGSAVSCVTVWDKVSRKRSVVPTNNGEYSFDKLPVGEWLITFTPTPGYDFPAPQYIKVSGGGTAKAAPTLATTGTVPSGSWLMDNEYHSFCSLIFSYEASLFHLSFTEPKAAMSMSLAGIENSPSSFSLGVANSPSQITFSTINSAGVTQQWTTVGGSGTVTAWLYTTNPRRVSGTFTCQALPLNGSAAPAKQISGKFVNMPY